MLKTEIKITEHALLRFQKRIFYLDYKHINLLFKNLLSSNVFAEKFVLLIGGQPEERNFIRGVYRGKIFYLVIDPVQNNVRTVYTEEMVQRLRRDAVKYNRSIW